MVRGHLLQPDLPGNAQRAGHFRWPRAGSRSDGAVDSNSGQAGLRNRHRTLVAGLRADHFHRADCVLSGFGNLDTDQVRLPTDLI